MLWSPSTDVFWRRDEWDGFEASKEQGRIEMGYEETETEAEDILSRNHIGKTKSMCFLLDSVDVKVNIYILIPSQ